MEQCALDPYEQQLLKVFDSYDLDGRGSLDRDGLTQLCQTLQLEEQGNELIRAILPDRKNSPPRATFMEFKDALLALLGSIQNKSSGNEEIEEAVVVEREVSPKLVYGSKKYGRRSRPKIDDTVPIKEQNDMNFINKSTIVQRSNSQCETYSKKRKPNSKLKRCTSFPGNNYHHRRDNGLVTTVMTGDSNDSATSSGNNAAISDHNLTCTEDMLREAWKSLGVGTDGYLNQTELVLVCDAIGLHQLANGVLRQLADKLVEDYHRRISFQELLEVLQHDDTWSEVLSGGGDLRMCGEGGGGDEDDVTITTFTAGIKLSPLRHLSLGPDGNGLITTDFLLDLWENAGITSPKSLLNDLGFSVTQSTIKVAELATVLERHCHHTSNHHNNHNSAYNSGGCCHQQDNVNSNNSQVVLSNHHNNSTTTIAVSGHHNTVISCHCHCHNNHSSSVGGSNNNNNNSSRDDSSNSDDSVAVMMMMSSCERITTVLQAFLSLYQVEIKTLREWLAQVTAEREKLRGDVGEANNRATLLAQEVDDNHGRMEERARGEVRQLELRHVETLREITGHFTGEKEHLSLLNQSLQQKIDSLEGEELKLRNELKSAQNYTATLDGENQRLIGRIEELTELRKSLAEQIVTLESDKVKNNTMQLEPLLAKLSQLQLENSELRDRNDEMVTEIECLTGEVTLLRPKANLTTLDNGSRSDERSVAYDDGEEQQQQEQLIGATTAGNLDQSMLCEEEEDGIGGLGGKRRNGDSPSKEFITFCPNGGSSPRLGKVRKFQRNNNPLESSESGFETEVDTSSSYSVDNEEFACLQAKITSLEQLLTLHSIPIPKQCNNSNNNKQLGSLATRKYNALVSHCRQLETILQTTKQSLSKMVLDSNQTSSNDLLLASLHDELDGTLTRNTSTNNHNNEVITTENNNATIENNNTATIENSTATIENNNNVKTIGELTATNLELSNCLELLRNEYERCENYWAAKLDDERQMFELEQKQDSERLSAVMAKLAEFEAQFASQDEADNGGGGRLPVIEEKCALEKQYLDLEEEFEEFKRHALRELERKDCQIAKLHKITNNREEIAVQTDDAFERNVLLQEKLVNLTKNHLEATNLITAPKSNNGEESLSSVWQQQTTAASSTSDNNCFSSFNAGEQPFSLPASLGEKKTPCRPKRTRKHDRNGVYRKINNNLDGDGDAVPSVAAPHHHHQQQQQWSGEEPTCAVPVNVLHGMKVRIHLLDQKNRHLQSVVKQQHWQYEKVVQYYWQQQRNDKSEYHYTVKTLQEHLEHQIRVCKEQLDKLSKTDLLVKDLYVENAYLSANVQRLQHLVSKYTSDSSSA